MKAAVCYRSGQSFVIEDRPDPVPGPDEVVVRVRRCGICGSELHLNEGPPRGFPGGFVMGHEYAGEVAEVGPGVSGFHEGDRVSKGQMLATLDPAPAQLQLQAAEAELAQAKAQRQLLDGKLAAVRVQAQRLADAAKAGAGDGQSADAAAASANELVAQQAAADAAVAMATQKRDAARYELGLRTLRAPVDARVVRVGAQTGASVSTTAGGPLFTLLPLTPPIVRAELSESFVDAVKVGMPATVSADGGGSSTQSWPAHVLRIGSVVGPSTLEDDPQLRANARTVACVLAFDAPPPANVRVGQRVLVRFGAPAAAAAPTKAR